jgi:hypothetical protein
MRSAKVGPLFERPSRPLAPGIGSRVEESVRDDGVSHAIRLNPVP